MPHGKIEVMTQLLSFHDFLKKFPLRHYKKGDMIVCEGVPPSRSYAIKTGFVKVFLTTKNGEEKAVAFNAADDIVPLAWTFKKSDVPLY
jgi:CRP-like cAMP-binding protein